MKIGRWSGISVNSKPLAEQLLGSFVKILSISAAGFEVILVGREINGKNDPENLMHEIHLFCHETDAILSLYSNRP